jgi:transcription termination factor Rho
VNPKIVEGIEKIRKAHVRIGGFEDTMERFRQIEENPFVLRVSDSKIEGAGEKVLGVTFVGQLETMNGASFLLPLSATADLAKIVVGVELIRAHDLRAGDVITCSTEKRQNLLVATEIHTVNGATVGRFSRFNFDDAKICYPYQRMAFCENGKPNKMLAKLLEWLVVVAKGQRGLVVAPPKTGKTTLLMEMAIAAKRANANVVTISLLVDQPPEAVSLYRDLVGNENLLFTTYEDSPEKQMFVAEFALKRAKRYAEMGKDVLLLVDSFNTLCRAFNETDESLGGKTLACGLESKTVQYLKRYFGTARCFERGGSLTMLGTLSINTGNPTDDLLRAELAPVSNLEIILSEELARRRIYPAIDLFDTRGKRASMATGIAEVATNDLIRSDYLSAFTIEDLYQVLDESATFQELEKKIEKQLKNKK